MKKHSPVVRNYDLEALEPRLLLSGDGIAGLLASENPEELEEPLSAVLEEAGMATNESDAGEAVAENDLFDVADEGLSGADPVEETQPLVVDLQVNAIPQDSILSVGQANESHGSMTEELVTTLHASNAPPDSGVVDFEQVAAFEPNTIVSGGQTLNTIGTEGQADQSVFFSAQNTVTTTPVALYASNSSQVALDITGDPQFLLTDLDIMGIIDTILQEYITDPSPSQTVFDYTGQTKELGGGLLSFTSPVITAEGDITYTDGGGWSGTITLTAESVTLSLGSVASASVTDGGDGDAFGVVASYTFTNQTVTNGGSFSISLDQVSVTALNGVVTAGGQGLVLAYDPTTGLTADGYAFASVNIDLSTNSDNSGDQVLSASGSGVLWIADDGIAAQAEVTLISGPAFPSQTISFDASFELKINTTGSLVDFIDGVEVNLPADYFRIEMTPGTGATADISIAGGTFSAALLILEKDGNDVTVAGSNVSFTFEAGSETVLSASSSAFAIRFTPVGLVAAVRDATASMPGFNNAFTLTGAVDFDINTTGADATLPVIGLVPGALGSVYIKATIKGTPATLAFTGLEFSATSLVFEYDGGDISFVGTGLSLTLTAGGETVFSATADFDFEFNSTTSQFIVNSATITVTSGISVGDFLVIGTPTVTITNLVIGPTGLVSGELTITAASVILFEGQPYTASVTDRDDATTDDDDPYGIEGTFNLTTGAFSLTLDAFELVLGEVFTASAVQVTISYDPDIVGDQDLVTINSGTIVFPKLDGLNVSLSNFILSTSGFRFESLVINVPGDHSIGSVLTISNFTITFTDFVVDFDALDTISGTLSISVESGTLFPSGPITASVEDTNSDGVGLIVTFVFVDGSFERMEIEADKVTFDISTYITLTATGVVINTDPPDERPFVVEFASISGTFNAGPLENLTVEAENIGITDAGKLRALPEGEFVVRITDFSSESLASVGWPSFLGFELSLLELKWDNIEESPENFTIRLSGSVTTFFDLGSDSGLIISGGVEGLVIDIGLLADGKFPFTSVDGFFVYLKGPLFGGEVEVGLSAMIVRIDTSTTPYTLLADGADPNGPNVESVFCVALLGGFSVPGVGMGMRLAMSSRGPLAFYVQADIPILLDPNTGLTLGGLRGGVEFSKEIPTPEDAFALRDPEFAPPGEKTMEQWIEELELQVLQQVIDDVSFTNPLAILTSPITISAGATLYTSYTSELVFRAEVDVSIDTTGKILINASAVFGDTLNAKTYLFGDLSKILQGTARFVFLVDLPEAIAGLEPLLSIYGEIKFEFLMALGEPMTTAQLQASYLKDRFVDTFEIEAAVTDPEFDLTYEPSSRADVIVEVNNEAKTAFSYDGEILTLIDTLAPGDKVTVSYKTEGEAISQNDEVPEGETWTEVTLTNIPVLTITPATDEAAAAEIDLVVRLDGVEQVYGTDYTLDSSTWVITFTSGIGEGSVISLTYRSTGIAQSEEVPTGDTWTEVTLSTVPIITDIPATPSEVATEIQLVVKVDDVELTYGTDYTLDSSTWVITFTSGVGEASIIDLTYRAFKTFSNPDAVPDSELTFKITIAGGALFSLPGDLYAAADGQVILSFSSTQFRLSFSAKMDVALIGNIGQAAGEFVVQYGGGLWGVWGAVEFSAGEGLTAFLGAGGIDLTGTVRLSLNSTDEAKVVNLNFPLPGAFPPYAPEELTSVEVTIKPLSFTLAIQADVAFRPVGTDFQLFRVNGFFYFELSNAGIEVFATGSLFLGPEGAEILEFQSTLLLIVKFTVIDTFEVGGIEIDIVGPYGFGGRVIMAISAGSEAIGIPGVSFNAVFSLVINTTLERLEFEIPVIDPAIPIIMGPNPDFYEGLAGADPLIPYEIDDAGTRKIIVPAGAPPSGDFDPADWTPVAPGIYLYIFGGGDIQFLDAFSMNGSFTIIAQISPVAVVFRLEFTMNLDLSPLGNVVATGSLEISAEGILANIAIAAGITIGEGLPVGLSLSGAFALEINTKATPGNILRPVIDPDTFLPTGATEEVEVAAHTIRVFVVGSVVINNLAEGQGGFQIEFSDDGLILLWSGNFTLLAGAVPLLAFRAGGAVILQDSGIAGRLSLSLYDSGLAIPGISFSASFHVVFNLTGTRQVIDVPATLALEGPDLSEGNEGGVISYKVWENQAIMPKGAPPDTLTNATAPDWDPADTGTAEDYFVVIASGSVTLLGAADITGTFQIIVSPSQVVISVDASLDLDVLGTPLFSFDVLGELLLRPDGAAGVLALSLSAGTPDVVADFGFSLSATFQLEFKAIPGALAHTFSGYEIANDGSVTGPTDITLDSGLYLRITAGGVLTLLDFYELSGKFIFDISDTGITLYAYASLQLGFLGSLTVEGGMTLSGDGIVARFSAIVDFDSSTLGLTLYGGVSISLNTTGVGAWFPDNSSPGNWVEPGFLIQGFVDVNIMGVVFLSGNIAFKLGPEVDVILADGTTETVRIISLSATDVVAFVGVNGPYWTDTDGDGVVDDPGELDGSSVGFHMTDLDFGMLLMESVGIGDSAIYLALKLSIFDFGLVGVPGFSASGAFNVELNIGLGVSGLDPSMVPVDLSSSFGEAVVLFNLIDESGDGVLDVTEQNAAFDAGYVGADINSVNELVAILDSLSGPPDGIVEMSVVNGFLSASFKSTNSAAMAALDGNGNSRLDSGYAVQTGGSSPPIYLDFNDFLINVALGGEISFGSTFRLSGVFLFELDPSGLKAFVAATLEIGPDIGASEGDKIFLMSALGALVINGDGIAADIDISVSVGGELSSVIEFNATARVVFNYTGSDQSITIPARFVNYLTNVTGLDQIPGSAIADSPDLDGLVVEGTSNLDPRFTVDPVDGSATFTISGGAPKLDGTFEDPGDYFRISMSGDLTVVSVFVISADFVLKVSDSSIEIGFNGDIDLGGFITLDIDGGAVIEGGVFAAYLSFDVNFDVIGINFVGAAIIEINSGSGLKTVYDAHGTGHDVAGNTYMVTLDVELDFLGIVKADGFLYVGLVGGTFEINVDASLNFFDIINFDIDGYFSVSSSGDITFRLTGSLFLDLTYEGFGMEGHLSVTLTNNTFTGSGSVAIVLFGQSFNIAAAELTVNWDNGSWSIYVEGPLSVWLRVSGDPDGDYTITGGLGILEDVLEALGDAAEAVGEAIVDAAKAVADAIVALGEAILDFAEDVLEFIDGVLTDIGEFFEGLFDEIASWFKDNKTEVEAKDIDPLYTYATDFNDGVLTITNNNTSSVNNQLALAIVDTTQGSKLIIDAPDFTESVVVAVKRYYTRYYYWDGLPPWGQWSSWSLQSTTEIKRNITFSNMQSFDASEVTKIVIYGNGADEVIVLDPESINIDTEVNAGGGHDVIVTGGGNDTVNAGGGDDTVFTNDGNDILMGEAGNDKLMGGLGDDELYGGIGNDLLDENESRDKEATEIIEITESNILDGGPGVDTLLGSPGPDIIEGGSGDDVIAGLINDDTYVFKNNYGTDTLVDGLGEETMDFSGMTHNLDADLTDSGFTANAGAGNSLVVDNFVIIKEYRLGSGNDDFGITAFPLNTSVPVVRITDAGGGDTYDLDLEPADASLALARLDIVDNGGSVDSIDLDLDSTGLQLYIHPQSVLLDNFELTYNSGVEEVNITDSAAATTVTTSASSGLTELLVGGEVSLVSASGGPITFLGRGDVTLEAGSYVETAGDVTIYGDNDDLDSTGAVIQLLGTIVANQVIVHGGDDDDTVTIGSVTSGTPTTIWTYVGSDTINIRSMNATTTINAGDDGDTINVGSLAPASGGNVNGIDAELIVNGDGGSDTLNVDDTGDTSSNSGTLTGTNITGLGMGGQITYNSISTLNVNLGSGGDIFTIESTHGNATNLHAGGGNDRVDIRTISGTTTVDSGTGSDTINVGSLAPASGGSVTGIGAALIIEGNTPTSGSDTLTVDDTANTTGNTGTLTSTTITGLGMAVGITYTGIEHLIISLGSGGDIFTINSTHGSATSPYQEETILNLGAGTDIVHINDVTDLLYVNGENDADTMNVNGTGAGSLSTLHGDNGNDIFNIRAMGGDVDVFGDAGNDTFNVGSVAPSLPGVPTNPTGNIDAIDGLLSVDGGTGTLDVLNVDDSNPATVTKSGTLTSSTIRGLELEEGIDYATLEYLNIWLASGGNTFTINSTHAGNTVVSTAVGEDTIHINDVNGILVVNGEANADTINVNGTSSGSDTTLNGNGGSDIFNVRAMAGAVTVNGNDGSDTINVGSLAPATNGNVNAIDVDLVVNGNGGTNTLNVDDTGDTLPNTGNLTSTHITGLGMGGSIIYGTITTLNINLGSGGDTFTIESTHTNATNLNTYGGSDIINIRTISGITTVDSGTASDTITVGSLAPVAGGNVNSIDAALIIEGNDPASGSDNLIVDDTGDTAGNVGFLTSTTITGLGMAVGITYTGIEHLVISLGSGGDIFTINSTHGSATSPYQEDTILNTGAGSDTIHINDVTDLLYVNGEDHGDTINVNGTGTGSLSTLHGDDGNDIFNIRGMDGDVDAFGDIGNDTFNVGSATPSLPGVPTNPTGNIDAINGLLTVDGGTGTLDVLNVDDSNPATTTKSGTLTNSTIRGLELEEGIDYTTLEYLNIWLASGANTFTINSTHAGETIVSTAAGEDTIHIYDSNGVLIVNGEADADKVTVWYTSAGSDTTINTQGGNDKIAVRTMDGPVTIDTGTESDVVNVGSNSTPDDNPYNVGGVLDGIQAALVIEGGLPTDSSDYLNIDESGETDDDSGVLTSTTLTGFQMAPAGITYTGFEYLNFWMGTGADELYIVSTHTGTTNVFGGDGTEVTGAVDDEIYINTISGLTNIRAEEGNDLIEVNVETSGGGYARTYLNGIGAVLNLHGNGGSDTYRVFLANEGDALINVHDQGAPDDGVDVLEIEGSLVDDLFLLRREFVALINDFDSSGDVTPADGVERVNYNEEINARLVVRGLTGEDRFIVDDNSSITTLDGGPGNDYFQIGQVFNTPRDGRDGFDPASVGIESDDQFETTAIFIGVITDSEGDVIFDPVNDELDAAAAAAIEAARLAALATGDGLAGVGYLSNGITHPTTAFGGDGNDTFSTYHNLATLRLDGEAGNDEFIVRAFVRLPSEAIEDQSETEVDGGAGEDFIAYTMNAPVSIEGGDGLDTLVIIGTVFSDNFVVTRDGIYGAGLNVSFSGIEKVEVDTLEGDDNIFVRSTAEGVVTTLTGGLGNDTIEIMGDVTGEIFTNDLFGMYSAINHNSDGADSDYSDIGMPGLEVLVVDPESGQLVDISQPDNHTRVGEGGLLDSYFILLTGAMPAGFDVVHLTISAGLSSTKDQGIGGDSIEVSLDGITWSRAVVLTVDSTTFGDLVEVHVRAIDDTGIEGERLVMVSHSINAGPGAADYENYPMPDIEVVVIDDDLPTLIVDQLDPDSLAIDFTTNVLEGGFTDLFTVRLNKAPAIGETVTVTLQPDADLTFSVSVLEFDDTNWDIAQSVMVTATDDVDLENTEIVKITHVVTSSGPVYASVSDVVVEATVYDNENANLILRETNGLTKVTVNGATDIYNLFLTMEPSDDVTVSITTDERTLVRLAGSADIFVTDLEITFVAGTTMWSDGIAIEIQANAAFTGSTDVRAFAYQPHTLDQLRGPIIVNGDVSPDSDRSLRAAVTLPTESDPVPESGDPIVPPGPVDSGLDVDVLNIYNDASQAPASGVLTYRGSVENDGYALTGFGMSGDLVLNAGTESVPEWVTYGGGITYGDLEIVEILFGKSEENLLIEGTAPDTIVVVHGGGADDVFTVDENGGNFTVQGPLVLYGDTAENGLEAGGRYSGVSGVASGNALSFNNPGDDTINGQQASAVLTIFGGPGNDILIGGQSGDQIAGGTGTDWIFGWSGDDHIYGDSQFNVDLDVLLTILRVTDPSHPDYDIEALEVVRGADASPDLIRGDDGMDTIFGDHGLITQEDGVRRIFSTAGVIAVESTNPDKGAGDLIYGNSGNDLILGGTGADYLHGGNSLLPLPSVFSASLVTGLDPYQTVSGGKFTVLQGFSESLPDDDVVFGDHGVITLSALGPLTINSIYYTVGDNDRLEGNAGQDILIGGVGRDELRGGSDSDLIMGDLGFIVLGSRSGNYVDRVDSAHAGATEAIRLIGSNDLMYGDAGDDILMGSVGSDRMDGGTGNDLLFGDNAVVDRSTRLGDFSSPRFRELIAGVMYDLDGIAQVTALHQLSPDGPSAWGDFQITLVDHADLTDTDLYGSDYIAGGTQDDVIFGQLGNDVIQGDGSIDLATDVSAARDSAGVLEVIPSVGTGDDGDDYIEGNGGNDVIFGNLGQDDIVGGSSTFFGLAGSETLRPDGTDMIFGGTGESGEIARNTYGDGSHARDADTIAGDNANIYRLVSTNSPTAYLFFLYDRPDLDSGYSETLKLIPRAVDLLDYTRGGPDWATAAVFNNGAADEIHGGSGDDQVYGMVGNDVLFGEAADDDLVGGWGHDWISGGSGDDGVLGDDGRIYTSRNTNSGEPIYGIAGMATKDLDLLITTPGKIQQAIINVTDELKKTVNLTPFNVEHTGMDKLYDPLFADDMIYGGLGNDFLHGGSGDDLISGAEALSEAWYETFDSAGNFVEFVRSDYTVPVNNGDALAFEARKAEEFAAYDEYNPLRKVMLNGGTYEYIANFDAMDSGAPWALTFDGLQDTVRTDGNDRIFGDLGNDWLVGGTGQDHLYGGYGNDLINADDDHETTAGSADPLANDLPDTFHSYQDIVYGGAGRDVLIANTGGDRLIDWVGEFNSYLVPFAPYGVATISRALQPQIAEYLYDLSESDGADPTRPDDSGADTARNGEPDGELGLVRQQDPDWKSQTGAPDDPQAGNIPGGRRDVLRAVGFNNGNADNFYIDSGTWSVLKGSYLVEPVERGMDALSVYHSGEYVPTYFEVMASLKPVKPTGGYDANSYLIFDYQSETDFKFAGINVSTNKLEIGHRTAEGWFVDVQGVVNGSLKSDTSYNVFVAINGTVVTVVVDNKYTLTHTFAARVDEHGISHGINEGLIGLGANNAKATIDNLILQVLAPETTFEQTVGFENGMEGLFVTPDSGGWNTSASHLIGTADGEPAIIRLDFDVEPTSLVKLSGSFDSAGEAGFVFDYYDADNYKFVTVSQETGEVMIGHRTDKGWFVDAVYSNAQIQDGGSQEIEILLKGTTISVTWNTQLVIGHAFNAVVTDGDLGLVSVDTQAAFDSVTFATDDPAFGSNEEPVIITDDPGVPPAISIHHTAGSSVVVVDDFVDDFVEDSVEEPTDDATPHVGSIVVDETDPTTEPTASVETTSTPIYHPSSFWGAAGPSASFSSIMGTVSLDDDLLREVTEDGDEESDGVLRYLY